MTADDMNVAIYIRERSEELQKLSQDARLDLLVHIFGMAALEAMNYENHELPSTAPRFDMRRLQGNADHDSVTIHRTALQEILEDLTNVAINRSDGETRAAFYLANDIGTSLHRVAGMNPAYGKLTDGLKIGTESLACGLAAAIRRPVITEDVTEDPTWREWKWLAEKFNYRGCWSFPIEGRGGKLLGTFSMYFKGPSPANDQDIRFASVMTDAAAEIISRHGRC
jgi:two-component system CheB/CheR fusion protein